MREKQSLVQSAINAAYDAGTSKTIFDIEILEAFRDILRAAERFDKLQGHPLIQAFDFQPAQVSKALRALHEEQGMAFITKKIIEADHPSHILRMVQPPPGALWCVVKHFKWQSGEVDHTSAYVTACFPASVSDEEALSHFHEHSDGPGRPFGNRPHLKRSKTRVLVSQHTGLDV
jgi:hypothetical protein